MVDAYDTDKDKPHYENKTPSQTRVSGPLDKLPRATVQGPSNSPEEKEADIVKPVDSNITTETSATPIADIAYIDKKEDGSLNIHHGDRKQTNTMFENEKIGAQKMRKLAETALKNYEMVKEAGPLGDILNMHYGAGTPDVQEARRILADRIRSARAQEREWEAAARSGAERSFAQERKLYDLADNMDKKILHTLGGGGPNARMVEEILRKGPPKLEDIYARYNLNSEGKVIPSMHPKDIQSIIVPELHPNLPGLERGRLATRIPIRGAPKGTVYTQNVEPPSDLRNILFGKYKIDRDVHGSNPQEVLETLRSTPNVYREGPLYGLGQGAQALIEKLKQLYGQHIQPGLENIGTKARSMAAEARPMAEDLADKAKDIFKRVHR